MGMCAQDAWRWWRTVEARAAAMLAAALRETLRIIIVIKKSSRMGGVRCEGSGVEVDESSWR